MTEQIIKDGVNVKKCIYLNPFNEYECFLYASTASERFCEGTNCYYKQLQREKQTNEELNKQLEKLVDEKYKLNEQLSNKTAECEELKAKLDEYEKYGGVIDEGKAWADEAMENRDKLQIATEALEHALWKFNWYGDRDLGPIVEQALKRIKE